MTTSLAPAYEQAASPTGTESLMALIVYLRPALRAQLLHACADLGVFVVEALPESLSGRLSAVVPYVDFAVVASGARAEDVEIVRRLAATLDLPVLAVMSPGTDAAIYREAGAFDCVIDGAGDRELGEAIFAIAAHARQARAASAHHSFTQTVFADTEFRPNPPELRRGGLVTALSRTERDVLEVLSGAIGSAVRSDEICRRAGSHGGVLSEGNLRCTILRIRKKAQSIGADRTLLRSVRAYGYVLRA
ncbi:MAG: transcriptional regulator [Dehalococcoidia bacterium]